MLVYQIRPGAYYDSVVLMQLQRALASLPNVVDAGVVMATPANKEILAANNLLPTPAEDTAKPDDLLIVIQAADEPSAQAALAQVDDLLRQRRSGGGDAGFRPKSLATAAKQLPTADWVLVSVPGRFAASVAEEALDLGKHVLLYSDNVPLADEIRLKQKARERGLLLMGPDCGTAIIHGIGLGFANRVQRGRIGLVGASGTGLQAITAAIHNLGGGVSHAIGTGGRDLKAEVGGITALQALQALANDPETQTIVLVSKPPSAEVAVRLLAAAWHTGKPVVVQFIGYPPPSRRVGNLHFATSLQEAAETAVELGQGTRDEGRGTRGEGQMTNVRALFSGGTLAYELLLCLQPFLTDLHSNIPIQPSQKLADVWRSVGHTVLDLGEDEFTQGRLHPMMDNDLRLRRLRQEAADPTVSLILLDVVLGEGAHPDPASELAPAIAQITRDGLQVAAVVIGTEQDPQDTAAQIAQLEAVGVRVFRTVNKLVEWVVARLLPPPVAQDWPAIQLGQSLSALNVGVASFYESLQAQGTTAVQVDWRPPAGGNEKLMAILAQMKGR